MRPDEPGRDKVLAAALALFGERGYGETSIADIGERAELSKSVVYHYFASKAELYEAVLEQRTGRLLEAVAEAVPAPGARGARLRPGVDAYLAALAADPAAWRLLVRDPPADPALVAVHERLAATRRSALGELLATADKRTADPLHVELVATAIRAFAAWWHDHPDVPRAHVVEAIADVAAAGARRL